MPSNHLYLFIDIVTILYVGLVLDRVFSARVYNTFGNILKSILKEEYFMKIFLNLIQKNSVTSTIILLACSFTLSLACSSSGGGGDSATSPSPIPDAPMPDAPIPEGLFLRPAYDADAKVYSNGQGLLSAGQNGSTNEVVIGTFDHDNLEIDDDPSDDISVGYSYRLAANANDDYSNADFKTENNQLSFIGTYSMPPYTLKIDIALSVAINLPDASYYDVDATNDDTDADTREFAFSGGGFSDTKEVAATGSDTAHRTIDVGEGKIYLADAVTGTGKIINFATADDLRIDANSFVIVTDKNDDGIGEVEAVAALPTDGTDFYVIGEAEATQVPETSEASVSVGALTFTAKEKGEAGNNLKLEFVHDSTATAITIDEPTIADGITTITINYGDSGNSLAQLKAAIEAHMEANVLLAISGTADTTALDDTAVITTGTTTTLALAGGADALYTHTATIGNVDVAIATTTSSEVVIKTIYTHTSGHITDYITDDAAASMATKDGTITITVFFDRQADTQDIIDALNTLDGVSAAIVSGGDATTHALTNDDYAPLYPLTITSSAPKGSVTLPGGLTITVTDTPAEEVDVIAGHTFVNAEGELQPSVVGIGTDNIGGTIYARIAFGLDSTLEDLYDQIYDDPNIEDTDPNDGINDNDPNYHQTLRVTKETGYDGTTKLVDIFAVSVTATPEVVLTTGDAPTANSTGYLFTATPEDPAPYQWETFGTPQTPEDYILNLAP